MSRVIFFVFICGCEQIEPSGNPLQPVQVSAPEVTPEAQEAETEDEAAGLSEEEETFSLSSEEMAPGGAVGVEEEDEKEEASAVEPTPSAVPETPAPEPPAPQRVASSWQQQVDKAWPVRLVTTVPNASPPRAILGLPDGREIVVNPGSMVPDLGLVVVAVSPGSAELAKIAPAGDHATIESVTLRAQY